MIYHCGKPVAYAQARSAAEEAYIGSLGEKQLRYVVHTTAQNLYYAYLLGALVYAHHHGVHYAYGCDQQRYAAYGAQQVLYLLHLLFSLLKCVLKGTGAVPHIVYGGLDLGDGVGAFALYHYAVVILGIKLHIVAVFLGELLHRLYIHKAVPRKLVVAWGYDAYGVYAVGLAGGRLAIAVARQNRIIIVVNVVIVEGELEF